MQRCMGCMKEFGKEYDVCPHCGYVVGTKPKMVSHLPGGTVISGRYTLGRVLGYGGFGITYLAWDEKLRRVVAIKEFFPHAISTRSEGSVEVLCYDEKTAEFFRNGVKKMIDEGHALSSFSSNANIVNIYDCFEENNTAYIVMEYLEGEDAKTFLNHQGGKLEPREAVRIILPVLNALEDMHKENLIHRDISPDNIFLCNDGKIKLLDFGSARIAVQDREKSLSVIIKPGYAPKEQYASRSKQGPWTDVYAVCATLYKLITGETPPESMDREESEIKQFAKFGTVGFEKLEQVILHGMAIEVKDRIQSVTELKAALMSAVEPEKAKRKPIVKQDSIAGKQVEKVNENKKFEPEDSSVPMPKPDKKKLSIIVSAAVAVIIAIVVFAVKPWNNIPLENSDETKLPEIISASDVLAQTDVLMPETTTGGATTQSPSITDYEKIYAAELAQYEYISSVYIDDINSDGYLDVFFTPSYHYHTAMTFTETAGMSIVDCDLHSSTPKPWYVSSDNGFYYRDDGHNQGTSDYHYAEFYEINDKGFIRNAAISGDNWEEFDWSDDDLFWEMDEKYDKAFDEKIAKCSAGKSFVDYDSVATSDPNLYEGEYVTSAQVDDYINRMLSVDMASVRKEYQEKSKMFENAVKKKTGSDSVTMYVTDFDRDGDFEAFAFIEKDYSEDAGYTGEIYFISSDGKVTLLENGDFWNKGRIIVTQYNSYFVVSRYAGSSSPMLIWKVDDKAEKINTIGEEMELPDDSLMAQNGYYIDESLMFVSNDYDGNLMSLSDESGIGHTIKPYFYYDTPDGIKEYGGMEITFDEFKKLNGANDILSYISQGGYTVKNIYFRENGIININLYTKSDDSGYDMGYLNVLYSNEELTKLSVDYDVVFGEGYYVAAKSPDIATYPKSINDLS